MDIHECNLMKIALSSLVIEHFVLMHIDMVTFRAAVTAKKFGVSK